jgi:chemotaxis protein CheZ
MSDLGQKLAKSFLANLEELKNEQGDTLSIGDIDIAFKKVRGERRNEVYEEIGHIAEIINTVKIEMQSPHAGQVSKEKMPDAHLELEAVIKAAEDATHIILDSAEKIQEEIGKLGLPEEVNTLIFEQITNIFEACNFQDITGQRISKVVHTLMEIDTSILELLEAINGKVEIEVKQVHKSETELTDEDLKNGPQLDAPTQDDIDKLFGG